MNQIPVIEQLADALRCLPGVGPKTAQRMVLHLLEHDRVGGRHLSGRLLDAMDKVVHCDVCRNFTETPRCEICSNPRRDHSVVCIVENPADVIAIEHTAGYQGGYFVLKEGHCLKPIHDNFHAHDQTDKHNAQENLRNTRHTVAL